MTLPVATLLGLFSVVFYAALAPMAKKMQLDLPPLTLMAVSTSLIALASFGLSFLFEKGFSFTSISPKSWTWLFAFAAINLFAFLFELLALQKIPSIPFQMLCVMSPVFTALIATFLMNEEWHNRYAIGLFFMAIGLFIALRDPSVPS